MVKPWSWWCQYLYTKCHLWINFKFQVHHRKLFRQLKLELAHCLLSSESAADDTKQRSKNKDYLDQITQSELNNRKLRRSQEEARVLQLVEKQNQAMLDREEALVRAEEREKAVAAAVQRRKKEQRRTWRKLREIRVSVEHLLYQCQNCSLLSLDLYRSVKRRKEGIRTKPSRSCCLLASSGGMD